MQQRRSISARDQHREEQQRRQREQLVAVRVGVLIQRGSAAISHTCSGCCGNRWLQLAFGHVLMVAGWGPDTPCRHWLQLYSCACELQQLSWGQLWCMKQIALYKVHGLWLTQLSRFDRRPQLSKLESSMLVPSSSASLAEAPP